MNSGSTTFIAVCLTALLGCACAQRTAAQVPTAPYRETLTVTVHEGTELVASLSPDGRHIAFILLGQTWLVDAAGGRANAVTNVVDDPRQDRAIAWAPDSRRLAVWSSDRALFRALDEATRTTLRTWNATGTFDPVWDRAGDRIIAAETSGDSTVLWSFPLDSGLAKTRVGAVPHRITGLTIARDGGTLAYGGPAPAQSPSSPGTTNLWELDLADRSRTTPHHGLGRRQLPSVFARRSVAGVHFGALRFTASLAPAARRRRAAAAHSSSGRWVRSHRRLIRAARRGGREVRPARSRTYRTPFLASILSSPLRRRRQRAGAAIPPCSSALPW